LAPYPRTTKPLYKGSAEPRITALICTLNEAANLPDLLPRIPDWVDEVLLVDGHSADETVEIARRLRPDIRVLFQPGKGDALRYGIKQASGDIVVTLDADGTTDPEDLHLFVEPLLSGYEFVKGSRFSRGLPANKPKHRMFGNFLIAMTFNVLYFRMYTYLFSGYNSTKARMSPFAFSIPMLRLTDRPPLFSLKKILMGTRWGIQAGSRTVS